MLSELFRLTRFEHALMLAFAVLIAEAITLGSLPPLEFYIILSLLVPMLSEMGSFALNDYFDAESDRANKKLDRPLVKGTISPVFAWNFSVACLGLSTILAFFINFYAFGIALAFNAFAVLYNWKLKDTPLFGNIYIAFTMAIPFIFGNYVISQQLSLLIMVLALLGFVAGLAREIIKSVQDMEGDFAARGARTLPVLIGRDASLAMAVLLYLVFLPLTYLPFILMGVPRPGAALIVIADALIVLVCIRIITEQDYRFARNMSLIAFFLGMVGILLASFPLPQ
ncbi:hypothetical protein GF318_02455 [Candidatus Micrarchaeota archaeon]|nr:hypothetical protein [Candidatus Micrarchaeota archaeon]